MGNYNEGKNKSQHLGVSACSSELGFWSSWVGHTGAGRRAWLTPEMTSRPVTSVAPSLLFGIHFDLWNFPVLQNLTRGCSPVTELSQLIQNQGELMLVKIELIFSGAGTFNGPLPHKHESTLTKQNWQIGRCQGFQGMGCGSLWSVPEGEKSRPNFLSS